MHKFSRSLLLAGIMAFGTAIVACDNSDTIVNPTPVSVSVTPPAATINVGESITLAASVTADENTAKTVTWTSSNAGTASVDGTGKVTGVKAGTVTITATSTADASKAAAAAITVNAGPVVVNPTIAINSVTQGGAPANLLGAAGQLDVTVNTSGGGLIEAFLSTSCTTNTIGAGETAVASQQATSAQAGTVTLSFNTAQLTAAGAPRFANGAYCIKTRLTNGTTVVVATNTIPLTLANVNSATGTVAFASQTGGPTSAVSTLNGLNYNQGTLTATVTPVVFTSTSPVALISGYLSRAGEQAGGASPGNAAFVNVPVTAGKAVITFADTSGAASTESIYQYTSLAIGDSLVITTATDAAGNPIALPNNALAVTGIKGLRIDNDIPLDAGVTYTVTAPNGYIGGLYAFSSGTSTAPAPTDTRGGVQGVGGVKVVYYVGAAGSTAFTTANSCDVTGLTIGVTGSSLANTTTTSADQAKVIVSDALGNKICRDVASSFAGGLFGVDKINPTLNDSLVAGATPATVAKDQTGYNTTRNFAFSLIDTISGFDGTPLVGTVTRNFFVAGTSTAADCLLGTYDPTAKTCKAVAGGFANGTEITNSTSTPGYYTFSALVQDQAGNVSVVKTITVAFDPAANVPTLGVLTQAPNPAVPLTSVTVSGAAADNFDLASTKGALTYATAPSPFQGVAGTAWTGFDATYTTSATASVALQASLLFRGLQSTTAGVIQANAAAPVASVTVSDVAGNVSAASTLTIVTNPAGPSNILGGNSFLLQGSNPSARASTTNLTVRVGGLSADPVFQSQPFATVQIFRLTGGELVPVGAAQAQASVSDDNVGNRTYTYALSSIPLGTGAAGTYNYYAVGRDAAGNAVISGLLAIVNP